MSKTKKCPDCGKLIHKKSTRCKLCAAKVSVITTNEKKTAPKYDDRKPADKLVMEYIAHDTLLLTAYQGMLSTQMKYHQYSVIRAINGIKDGVTAFTFDPLVYDKKQETKTITINKDTRIEGV